MDWRNPIHLPDQALGAQVRKGETATPIVYYRPLEVADEKADIAKGDDPTKIIRMVRGYWGFNADQVDGYALPAMPTDTLVQRVEHAETFFANLKIPITHGGSRAFYRPSEDRIQMPDKVLFRHTKTSTATEGYPAAPNTRPVTPRVRSTVSTATCPAGSDHPFTEWKNVSPS